MKRKMHDVRESQSARHLHFHRFILRLALSAGNIFAWIFVFRMFYDENDILVLAIAGTAILYALSHAITFIVTPLSSAALRFGTRRALLYGSYAAALSYASLAFALWAYDFGHEFSFLALSLFVISSALHRALYWIPYHTAEVETHALRAPYAFVRETAVALMPALAGLLIETVIGAPATLTLIAALAILSTFPLSFLRERHERFDWTYPETLKALFHTAHRRPMLVYVLDGMQGAALLMVWPLAVFLILGMSYEAMGLILTATLCIAFLVRLLVRHILRRLRLEKSVSVNAALAFSAWVLRLSAGSPFQILAVDTYYQAGNPPKRFSVDQFAFDQYADGGHYVDEYTALKEMGLSIGRIIMSLLLAVLAILSVESLALSVSIVVAALSAGLSVLLAKRLQRSAF